MDVSNGCDLVSGEGVWFALLDGDEGEETGEVSSVVWCLIPVSYSVVIKGFIAAILVGGAGSTAHERSCTDDDLLLVAELVT